MPFTGSCRLGSGTGPKVLPIATVSHRQYQICFPKLVLAVFRYFFLVFRSSERFLIFFPSANSVRIRIRENASSSNRQVKIFNQTNVFHQLIGPCFICDVNMACTVVILINATKQFDTLYKILSEEVNSRRSE